MNSLEDKKSWNITILESGLIKMVTDLLGEHWPVSDCDFDVEILAHNSDDKITAINRIEILITKKDVEIEAGKSGLFDLIMIDDGGIK